MKTAHRMANIISVTESGSSEREELLEALFHEHRETMRHYDGMEVRARAERDDADDYRTYEAVVTAFEDDSMILGLRSSDDLPRHADPFDLDDPDDALRAAVLLKETQLGPTMMAYLARALERDVDWRIEDVDPKPSDGTA